MRIYPVVTARSGSRAKHAAKTVMPAAVTSIVFPEVEEREQPSRQPLGGNTSEEESFPHYYP